MIIELYGEGVYMDNIKPFTKLTTDVVSAVDMTTIIVITDDKGVITHVNENFCEMTKYDREELIGQNFQFTNAEGYTQAFYEDLCSTLKSGNVWKGEIKRKTKDNGFFWVHTTVVPFLDEYGNPYQYISINKDITARKQTEETLKITMDKLAMSNKDLMDIKQALDESSIVAITDNNGIITYVNENFCNISKFKREELIGQDHRILNSGYHSKDFFRKLWKTIGQGKVWKGEIKNKAKDGSYYWVQTTIVPYLNEEGKPYQYAAIRNDITDQKNSEELLLRSEKLSAIGELAAGVAHEIRNPLTTLKGFLDFLKVDEVDDKKKFYFNLLLDEVERINFIAGEFMLLAKPQAVHLSDSRLIPLIQKVIIFLESEFNLKNIIISLDYEDEDLMIKCEENQLKQVFLNFIKNAIEAMPDGGNIYIKVKELEDMVEIIFKDEGVGIPEEDIPKLGQPFFTRKETGNGLGMTVSFKIIQNHNGVVDIESEEGKGTTFSVKFPLLDKES